MSGFSFARTSCSPVGSGFSSNASSAASGSSLFGSSLFGSSSSAQASTGTHLFGVNSGNYAQSTAASAPSLFGASTVQTSPSRRSNSTVPPSVNKPHANVNKAKSDAEENMEKRISFLSGFVVAFKERIHTDIQLKPNNGPCIPAHKALLAARSEIFKNMLDSDSDGCKAPPSDTDTITLSELNTKELESLLEFLYTGNLPFDRLEERHVYSLYVAAEKYEIPYLKDSCERHMLNSLNTLNAIDILEISDAQSSKTLKETALNFIIKNMKEIVSTTKYEEFASSNPPLCVQITRAFVDAKSN